MTAVNKLAFGKRWFVLLSITICFCFSAAGLAEESQKPERFISRTVKNISPEKAIQYLSQAGLGTVSQIPNTNTVLITAEPALLNKAKVMLEVIDSAEPVSVKVLPVFEELANQPIRELIAERVKNENIDIGSFNEPPSKNTLSKALIDTNNGQIIIVAEQGKFEKIMSAFQDILAEKEVVAEVKSEPNAAVIQPETETAKIPDVNTTVASEQPAPTDTNTAGNDQFFNGLLKSLAEAEKIETELKATEAKKALVDSELQKDTASHHAIKYSEVVELETQKNRPEMTRLSYNPEKVEMANETLELDLPETLNIIDLIDLTGRYLGLDLLYDPLEVKGTVTLRVQKKITVGELYPLLESVLKFRGFMTSRKGNLVTIVPVARAEEIDPLLLDGEAKTVKYGDTVITRVFDLRYIDAQSAENLLNQMKLGANILSIPAASKLFVTGYAYRMGRIEEVLSIIDQPGKLKQFRYRQLRFTMARNLVTQVQSLAEQLGTVSVTVSAAPTAAETFEAGPTRRGRPSRITPQPQPTATQPTTTTGPSVYLEADERTNRVLMIGLQEDLEIIERLTDSLDVAQQDLRTFRLYQMQYIGAEEMMDKLMQFKIISGQKTTAEDTTRRLLTRRQQQQQQQQPVPEQQASSEAVEVTEEGLVEKPAAVIVELTNSLLINATAEQHAQIATIIAYVDAEPEEAATNFVVYPLENQDPVELAAVLNQLIQETISETQGEDNKIVTTQISKPKSNEDITIIPDPKTYSLIVYGSKKNQQWVGSLVKQLDEYRPQVLLDAILVEITQNDKFEYDLDIISKTYSGSTLQSSQVGQLEDFTLNRYADLRSTTSATDSVIKAFLNAENVQALITAIQQNGYGRIMARPKILVNDNQEGQIKTENTVSVAQVKSIVTVPEGGSPYTTQDVTFNDYQAGVTLNIKPHISKGDMLRLEINLNRTDFKLKDPVEIIGQNGVKQTFPSPPDRLSTDVLTVGTVPNGTTIVLGGLESLNQSKGNSKVPIMGDLPLVGGLFRGVTNTGSQNRLYVFVKANIIRPGDQIAGLEDIKRISEENRKTFEKYEDRFQKMEDWPGIKSTPMDPVRILDND